MIETTEGRRERAMNSPTIMPNSCSPLAETTFDELLSFLSRKQLFKGFTAHKEMISFN